MRRLSFLALLAALALAAPQALHADEARGEIRWLDAGSPGADLRALDGSPLEGDLGVIEVPENRARPGSKSLEIAFVRFRTTHPDPGPPIFFLAGGPGGSGIEGAAIVATHPQIRLLEHSDVIGVDQRGTGRSLPDLTSFRATSRRRLPLDRALSRQELLDALERAARETGEYWRGRGVDLAAYTTAESADDLEAVRRALEIPKIVLYGGSYGSHLGLAYLRRHGERVERAVLSKVEGPDHTFKLPSTVQRHLERVQAELAANPAIGLPDLEETLRRLLRTLETAVVFAEPPPEADAEEPVAEGATPGAVRLSPIDLQIAVARALASSRDLAALPATLARFERGEWAELAATALEIRRLEVH
ncbi:MAG: alpha/beta fold hydrolase, partial [Acidobacteriota bacterium]